jgi:hypothetical protein
MQFRVGAVHAMVLFIDCMNSSQISLLAANRFNFNIGNKEKKHIVAYATWRVLIGRKLPSTVKHSHASKWVQL